MKNRPLRGFLFVRLACAFLSLALTLPSSAYGLRPTNAGMEESGTRERLEEELAGNPWNQPGSAEAYARFARHPEYIQANRHLLDLLRQHGLGTGQVVIDVASGTGTGSLPLAELVGPEGKVIGVDNSAAMVAYAERNLPDTLRSRVEYRLGDALNLNSIARENPRAVVSFNAIHLIPDLKQFLAEARQTLPPGGILAFNTTFTKESIPVESGRTYLAIAERAKDLLQAEFPEAAAAPRKRLRALSQRDYVRLVEEAGFIVLAQDKQTIPMTHSALNDFVRVPGAGDFWIPLQIPHQDKQRILVRAVREALDEM